MKIDYLQINSQFKNLNNVRIDFNENELMTIIVGWNGAGKSNVLEALVSIFRNLDLGESPVFAFEIKYKLGDEFSNQWILVKADPSWGETPSKQYQIRSRELNENNISGDETWDPIPLSKVTRDKEGQSQYLPRHVFAYYSGASDRLEVYFKKHRTNFYYKLLKNQLKIKGEIRPLFYAKPIHSQFVLLAFFLGQSSSQELSFLRDLIGIEDLDSIHIVLRRPNWTRVNNKDELFWGASGVVREFLDRVFPESLAPIKITRTEDTSLTGTNIKNEFFHLFLPDIHSLRKVAGNLNPDEFFKMLESTLLSDIISEVRVRVKIKDVDQALSFRELSEGEQQLLTVLGLLKFTCGTDTLFLLDEPDTHLNPAWDVKYLSYLRDFVQNISTSQLIMVTHNPLAIAELTKNQVQIMWKDKNSNIYVSEPEEDPRGMGYAGILTSDMFGLGSTLDEFTTNLLRERQDILEKEEIDSINRIKLIDLNEKIESLGFSNFDWESDYAQYLRLRNKLYPDIFEKNIDRSPEIMKARTEKAQLIIQNILENENQSIEIDRFSENMKAITEKDHEMLNSVLINVYKSFEFIQSSENIKNIFEIIRESYLKFIVDENKPVGIEQLPTTKEMAGEIIKKVNKTEKKNLGDK